MGKAINGGILWYSLGVQCLLKMLFTFPGRGSMQGDSDGWNTVPAKPIRQQVDAAKMKITKVTWILSFSSV